MPTVQQFDPSLCTCAGWPKKRPCESCSSSSSSLQRARGLGSQRRAPMAAAPCQPRLQASRHPDPPQLPLQRRLQEQNLLLQVALARPRAPPARSRQRALPRLPTAVAASSPLLSPRFAAKVVRRRGARRRRRQGPSRRPSRQQQQAPRRRGCQPPRQRHPRRRRRRLRAAAVAAAPAARRLPLSSSRNSSRSSSRSSNSSSSTSLRCA